MTAPRIPATFALGDVSPHLDTHRLPIRVGDRVVVIAVGFGARLSDVRETGVVAGWTRSRIRVDLGYEVRTIAGDCLAILDRSDETSSRQEGNVRRALVLVEVGQHAYVAGDDLDRMTLDHSVACAVCGNGEGDLIHAAAAMRAAAEPASDLSPLAAYAARSEAETAPTNADLWK